ncbi:ABC transporter ATP-binding protein [Acuticoccus sp. I52.16.1]|uniref:ABC transporter ATP-binding protein n=1 Tax=Acuticoccus sp. I52.16.1 TaxID=2928472 RepID=UPI001FD3F91E|nr:ABC transporter ATP-binding protein [Acuticoccus sp. I52.16.1]UOM36753.1 ABC transporter ATP-binding protein/permease [Acuticoccus sp. I52.16.1]
MLKTVADLLSVLSPRRRRTFWVLIGLYVVVGLAQAAGVAAIGPFVAVALGPEQAVSGGRLAKVYSSLGFSSPRDFLVVLGVVAAGLIIVGQTSFLLVERMRLKWMHGTQAELSRNMLRTILSRPYAFFATRHSGALGNLVLGETNQAAQRFIFPMIEAFSRLTIIVFLIAMMLFVDAVVALGTAFLLGLIATAMYFITVRRLKRAGQRMREINEQRFTRVIEIFAGHKEMKLRGSEESAVRQYQSLVFHYANIAARAEFLRVAPRPIVEVFVFAGIIVVVIIMALTSPLALTAMMPKAAVFLLAGYRILPGVQLALQTLQGMRTGEAVVRNVLKEVRTPAPSSPQGYVPQALVQAVAGFRTFTLTDVTYSYPDAERSALQGVNLVVPRNSCIGIVGASGAGKSTLMDVMLGLLQPSSGALDVDGKALDAQALAAWRTSVGYVAQSVFISDDTIAANVAFGHDKPDMDRVREAIRLAALEPYVAADPNGLQAHVGERGGRMSGGQRQRLAIARALYNDPAVLFLDEATSALDVDTETQIMNELRGLVGTRTLIIITHRLSTLTICDTILEMADGRVKRIMKAADFFSSSS